MVYVNDLELPQISSADACRVAGISRDTLKNWISRKPSAILLTNEERAAASSAGFAFSLRRVYQIAITAELVAFGLSPRHASLIAAGFSDIGAGQPCPPELDREAGELFETGWTYLVAGRDEETGWVERVMPNTPVIELIHRQVGTATIVLELNRLVRRIHTELGIAADA